MDKVDLPFANRLKTMIEDWKRRGNTYTTGNGDYDNGVDSGMHSCADELETLVNEYCTEWHKKD